MATQLKDLKFGDYTLKGETDNDYTHFVLGENDSFGYIGTTPGGGSSEYHSIIDLRGSGSIVWWFHGTADEAVKANTVTCYDDQNPETVAGTYKLLINGSGVVTATPVNS